jgi:hypothetical protein
VVFRDTSVDADSFAFAEVALRVPSDALVLTRTKTEMSKLRAVEVQLELTKPSG